MRRALRGALAGLLVSVSLGAAGCGLLSPSTITENTTTTSSTTTSTTLPEPTWREVEPNGAVPSPRCYQSMVYDSTTGKIIMFGGVGASDALRETWAYDLLSNEWVELDAESEQQPSGARQIAAAYDPTRLAVVSFDGSTWRYDVSNNEWQTLAPKGDTLAPARIGACMVMDQKSGRIILFGGTDLSESYNETWSYDPAANTWTDLKPEGNVPPGRSDAGMAYEPTSGNVVLFGGVDSDFTCLNDTWTYDPVSNTWTELVTSLAPAARSGLGFAYDRHSGQLVMFGGIDSQLICYNDTWALDPATGTWKELAPSGYWPLARGRVSMVYAPSLDKLVVFGGAAIQADASGGFGGVVYLNDMWTFGIQAAEGDSAAGDTTQ